jgi:NADH-quinone oxidoreductase subunit H
MVLFLFVFIWLRGSLPRIRYDQLMAFGWKVLIPGALAWTLLIAAVRLVRRDGFGNHVVDLILGLVVAAVIAALYAWDVASERRVERRAAEDAESIERYGGAFPVPPLDLPHYHGVAATPSARGQAASEDLAASVGDRMVQEKGGVAGA